MPNSQLTAAADAVVAAGAPGVVVYVRDHDRTTVVARGFADVATKRRASADDHFRVGSVTKSFVATVILQLAAEHKLALDDPIAKYVPLLVPNGNGITLRQLLSHTSGLFDYFNDRQVLAPYLSGHLDYAWTPVQLVRMAVAHKPLFAPGAPGKWSYSNTGYQLLGLAIEHVTGKSLALELERRIFRPLGLTDTSFAPNAAMPAPYAHGYTNVIGSELDVSSLSLTLGGAAGAIVSTPADVADFYRALLSARLVPHRFVAQMERRVVRVPGAPAGFIYGLGLYRERLSCSFVWGHNGDFPGYSTNAFSSKDGSRQVVVLVNADAESSWTRTERAAVDGLINTAYCG